VIDLPDRHLAGSVRTPVGQVVVVAGPAGVSSIGFYDPPGCVPVDQRALQSVTDAVLDWFDDPTSLEGLPIDAPVSDFATAVRAALLEVPVGSTTTYGELARRLGRPTASRDVGRTVGANPVAIAIPCHRVVCSDGSPGGYAWGVERKLTLLHLEEHHRHRGGPS